MGRELGRAPQLVSVGVDERLGEPRGQRGGVEAEVAEEVREADRCRHLAVVNRAEPFGLSPARDQRLVAGLEPDLGRMGGEQGVQVAGRRAHGLAVDLDRRHSLAVEADERVEEVEEDGGVGHQRGFRAA